jgi:hypothetical protein
MVLRVQRAIAVLGLLAFLGCSTTVERRAEKNRTRLNKVRLGLTFVEVERIVGPPERRAARLRYDGVSIEEWSYVTDSMRKMDGLILFVGGKVEEIQSTSWDESVRDQLSSEMPRR